MSALVAIGVVVLLALLLVVSTNSPPAAIEVDEAELIIRPRGLNRLWAMRGRLRIPRSSLVDVVLGVPKRSAPSGFRMPGTAVPGLIQAGTYRGRDGKSFWLVGRAKSVSVIRTTGAFSAVVVELSDSDAAALATAAPRPDGGGVRRVVR